MKVKTGNFLTKFCFSFIFSAILIAGVLAPSPPASAHKLALAAISAKKVPQPRIIQRPQVISISEKGFKPRNIVINQGDAIIFKNTGQQEHWPASSIHPTHQIYPEFDQKQAIVPGQSWSFTFKKAGVWRFHDHLYPELVGSVTVKSKPAPRRKTSSAKQESPASLAPSPAAPPKTIPTDPPSNLEEMLAGVNMMTAANNEAEIRSWLTLAGPKKVMEELLADSGGGAIIDCHRQSHNIGRLAYKIYGAAAFGQGSAACHSGYYHGAMESFLQEKGTLNFAENIRQICDNFGTAFGRFECLHGVGHGVLAYEDYDLPKALELCGLLPTDYDRTSCYGGLFMENIVTAQGFGAVSRHVTKWLNREDPHFPCNQFGRDQRIEYQCYQMQTSWMLTLFPNNFAKAAEECLKAPERMIPVCFKSLGRDAAGHTLRNIEKIVNICSQAPPTDNYYEQCVIGAVNVIVDFWGDGLKDQATELCKQVAEKGKPACYGTLAGRLNDVFRAPEQKEAICRGFEANFQNFCG